MKLKAGVSLKGLQPQMCVAMMVVEDCYQRQVPAHEVWITSANDGTHGVDSLHKLNGICRALDFRTKDYSGNKEELRNDIKVSLGDEFDVVLEHLGGEQEHIHVEYDPK